jgi:hypothetical protein
MMNRSTKQGLITVAFAGLLGVAALCGSSGGPSGAWNVLTGKTSAGNPAIGAASDAVSRYGFKLTESSKSLGVEFHHEPSELDSKLAHIMPLVNSMGAGVTVVDFDKDGWLDIYAVTSKQGAKNALWRNLANGTFEDKSTALGVADLNQPGTGACTGTVWADFDNDGFDDMFVCKWGRPELFRNQAGKGFERITDRANLPKWLNVNAACWFDYDRDGRLDLFLTGYWADEIDLWKLNDTRIMPESFEYAKNGGRKHLMHNLGGGVFEDVTEAMGITSTRWTLGVAAADLCGTGFQDLVLANDYGVSEFYANRDGKKFEEVGYDTGIGVAPKSGMSVSFGDVLNTGRLSMYVSNITEPGNLVQGNNLWMPAVESTQELPRYLNQAGSLNVERGGWSWGAKFGDLNNDGRIDLYLTNGYVSSDKGASYWYDYGKIAGGLKGLIGDAKFWPPIGNQSLAGFQAKCVWMNKGGEFIDVAAAVGVADVYDGRAVALADFSNRGRLDVVVANQNGPLLFYQNEVAETNQWIQFALEGGATPGHEAGWSNRSAVGAEILLTWRNGTGGLLQKQLAVVNAGDAHASQSMLRVHFGLGKDPLIESAIIKWPSGHIQTLTAIMPNTLHPVKETSPGEQQR